MTQNASEIQYGYRNEYNAHNLFTKGRAKENQKKKKRRNDRTIGIVNPV